MFERHRPSDLARAFAPRTTSSMVGFDFGFRLRVEGLFAAVGFAAFSAFFASGSAPLSESTAGRLAPFRIGRRGEAARTAGFSSSVDGTGDQQSVPRRGLTGGGRVLRKEY